MENEKVVPRLIYRSMDGELTVSYSDGTSDDMSDWSKTTALAVEKAVRRNGYPTVFDVPQEVAIAINTSDIVFSDGNKQGGTKGGQDPDQDDQGGSEDDHGDQGSQGDSDGDQGDSGDDGDEPGEQGEQGDQQGDQQGDTEGESLDFQEGEGEGDPFGDPFADDLWPVIRPRVVEIAETRAEQAFFAANRYSRLNGGGNGSGGSGKRTIRVSGVKTGEIEGVSHFQFEKVLQAVARGCHVYLPGPPGTGKSHMAVQVAEALGRDLAVSSFSPMSTESKLIGFRDANGNTVRTQYREAYEKGWVWLGDELDNSNPAIVAGLNSGLANGFMEFPDGTIKRHKDFVCIATANTMGTGPTAEFAGRQKLDPATLNRFVKIFIGTDEVMETHLVEQILPEKTAERWLSKVRHIRRAVDEHRIKHFVTMRDSIQGARLIAPGDGKFTIQEALEMTILAVLTDDQRAKIKGR